jgi:Tol biopolymer transport system component
MAANRHSFAAAVAYVVVACPILAQSLGFYTINLDGTRFRKLVTLDTNVTRISKLSFNQNGSLLTASLTQGGRARLFLVKPDGSGMREVTRNDSPDSWGATFSRDGTKLFFISKALDGKFDLYSMNLDGTAKTLVKEDVWSAEFSSDGSKIVFSREEPPKGIAVFVSNSDGSGEQRIVEGQGVWDPHPSFNPKDLNQVIFTGISAETGVSIHVRNLQQSTAAVLIDNKRGIFVGDSARFTTDGQQVICSGTHMPFSLHGPPTGSDLYRVRIDGSAIQPITTKNPGITFYGPVMHPDGMRIVFVGNTVRGNSNAQERSR